ncbi:MAG: site-2 protease family protein [Bdellovibrionales bacterium]|nr:site-2 protease family protein [Bdellovibrionales bacterium]
MLIKLIAAAPPLLVAVILHEIAHGWAAEKLGDPTARSLGRITVNPLRHADPFLTLLLPGMLILAGSPVIFGGAKPVPVNPLYFKNPRRDMAYVALAGPVTNFVLAAICYILLQSLTNSIVAFFVPPLILGLLALWLVHGVLINLVLGLFNLLPVPPLDGGRIAVGFLPIRAARAWARLEPFGLLIVIALLFSGVIEATLGPIVEHTAKHLLRFE